MPAASMVCLAVAESRRPMAAMWPSRIAMSARVPRRARAVDDVAVADNQVVVLCEQAQRNEKQKRKLHSATIAAHVRQDVILPGRSKA